MILVAEAPTSDGQVRRRSCRRADTNTSYPTPFNFSGATSRRTSVYVEFPVTGNENFDIVCEIQIGLTPTVCTISVKVLDEDEVEGEVKHELF